MHEVGICGGVGVGVGVGIVVFILLVGAVILLDVDEFMLVGTVVTVLLIEVVVEFD